MNNIDVFHDFCGNNCLYPNHGDMDIINSAACIYMFMVGKYPCSYVGQTVNPRNRWGLDNGMLLESYKGPFKWAINWNSKVNDSFGVKAYWAHTNQYCSRTLDALEKELIHMCEDVDGVITLEVLKARANHIKNGELISEQSTRRQSDDPSSIREDYGATL